MTCLKLWGAPGTGKTTRLIHEINRLLDNGYVKNDFVVTTFRKPMAEELRSRLQWDKEGIVSTLHAACRRLAGMNERVVENRDRAEFCKAVGLAFEDANGSGNDEHEPTNYNNEKTGNLFFDARHYIINNLLDIERIYRYPQADRLEEMVPDPVAFMATFSEKYRQWKGENNLVDFDDMLLAVHEQKNRPEARILVVDEFQDLTPLQYAIISMWEERMEHILIGGDPRQTIYGFWGASAKFFEQHEGDLIVLSTSYRLPAEIWKYATRILRRAGLTYPDIQTTDKPGILEKVTETAYYERLHAPAFRENTMHLVRINEMGIGIARALAEAGIPFTGISGWGLKQINLYNAIVKIRKGMGEGRDDEKVFLSADEIDELLDVYPKKEFAFPKTAIRKQFDTKKSFSFGEIRHWASLDIYGKRGLWHKIASDSVLEDTLNEYKDRESLKHIKVLHALRNYGKVIDSPTVSVSTIHAAKGGEAQYIFLHDAITKKIADKLYSDIDEETIQNEAQVFYVGATRAMQALFIVESDSKYRYALPSIKEST